MVGKKCVFRPKRNVGKVEQERSAIGNEFQIFGAGKVTNGDHLLKPYLSWENLASNASNVNIRAIRFNFWKIQHDSVDWWSAPWKAPRSTGFPGLFFNWSKIFTTTRSSESEVFLEFMNLLDNRVLKKSNSVHAASLYADCRGLKLSFWARCGRRTLMIFEIPSDIGASIS